MASKMSMRCMWMCRFFSLRMEYAAIDEAFDPIRKEKNLHIHMQRMDIFDAMHRI